MDRPDYLLVHGRSLNRADPAAHRMALDLGAIVFPEIHIDPEDSTISPEKFEHGGVEDEGAASRDSGLHDQVGPGLPDDLLHGNDVLRKLDDGPPQPSEVIRILVARS